MPRISDERREARREQVLEAARACLQEQGLEAVSMETIVARSGLSTGAVYGYFKGKDEILNAAVTEGTAELASELIPILENPVPPPLPELFGQVLQTVVEFGRHKRGGIDRLLVAIHGWSHSQSDPTLKASSKAGYRRLREIVAETARRSQLTGTLDARLDPDDVAELMTSLTLGFVAQQVMTGKADVQAHVRALKMLMGAQ
jgi:TetR/AcrR family transcriptional regulator, transcriptional repressor of aconitase